MTHDELLVNVLSMLLAPAAVDVDVAEVFGKNTVVVEIEVMLGKGVLEEVVGPKQCISMPRI